MITLKAGLVATMQFETAILIYCAANFFRRNSGRTLRMPLQPQMYLPPMPNLHCKKEQNSSFLQKPQTNASKASEPRIIKTSQTHRWRPYRYDVNTYRYDVNLEDVDQLYDALETDQLHKINSDPVGYQPTSKSNIFVETFKKNLSTPNFNTTEIMRKTRDEVIARQSKSTNFAQTPSISVDKQSEINNGSNRNSLQLGLFQLTFPRLTSPYWN